MNLMFADLATVAQIIFVNIVLSGDNALVIGTYSNGLPPALRRRAVLWGSGLSVVLQILFALVVGHLLGVPGLRLVGACALLLIARRLVFSPPHDAASEARSTHKTWGAILAVLAANVAMSFDNVLAVGVLSRGEPWLTAFGVLVSAGVLLAVSSLVVRLLQRFPSAVWGGAVLLSCTAAGLVCEEPLLAEFFNPAAPVETAAASPKAEVAGAAAIELPHSTLATVPKSLSEYAPSRIWIAYGLAISLCFAHPRLIRMSLRLECDERADSVYVVSECQSA